MQLNSRYGSQTVVTTLIVVTVVFFFVQLFGFDSLLVEHFSLVPDKVVRGQVWRLFTYGFLHDTQSIWHVAFNMFGLFMFGRELEYRMGREQFLFFYLASIVVSGFFCMLNIPFGNGFVHIIGASGGIFSLLFVYGAYYPETTLYLYFTIPVPIRVAIVLFALVSLAGAVGGNDGIAHLGHLGGFGAGWIWLILEKRGVDLDVIKRLKRPKNVYSFTQKTQYDVDVLLRKIHTKGVGSLTPEEKQFLEREAGRGRS